MSDLLDTCPFHSRLPDFKQASVHYRISADLVSAALLRPPRSLRSSRPSLGENPSLFSRAVLIHILLCIILFEGGDKLEMESRSSQMMAGFPEGWTPSDKEITGGSYAADPLRLCDRLSFRF